jgi:cell division protein FtsL
VAAPVLSTALPVLLCAGLAILFIWTRTRALGAAYELAEEKKQHDLLTSRHGQLQLEVETLRSPVALEGWARANLGMAPPAPGAVLAAGPRMAAGRAGVDGVGHRSAPAEPQSGRAAGARQASSDAWRDAVVSGERVALRGPSRATRAE